MRMRNIHTRIIASFFGLLLIAQSLGLAAVDGVITRSANQDIQQTLVAGEQLFNSLRKNTSNRLTESASILTSDFGFVKAIATADQDTIVSVLHNHGARIHADITLLMGTDYRLIADTLNASLVGKLFPFPELIKTAENQGQTTSLVMLNGNLYQLVIVPVYAPLPIAWLALGFVIDDKFAQNLHSLTALDVSFLIRSQPSGDWKLLASTLPPNQSALLPKPLMKADNPSTGATIFKVGDEDYLGRFPRLEVSNGEVAIAVLQKSLRTALAPLRRLQLILMGIGGISLLATFIASNRIARNISKPIQELGVLAHNVEQGNYKQSIALDREDEVGQLASAFNHMTKAIATREERITELAYRDPLTGLPNRTLFLERLSQTLNISQRENQTFAVLIMDIDRFKDVNDILGHHIGDLLLKEVVKQLQSVLPRDSDSVARLGGDEFGLLMEKCDTQAAQTIAQKIVETLTQTILLDGQQVIASGSIGIAIYPEHGTDISSLLRHADMAMYVSKRNNSGYAFYTASIESRSKQNVSLMAELRHAVEHNELTLYYQPKVDISTGKISQVEALVRWIHPRAVIPPNEFIPFAELTGYIRTITQWVITHALQQRKAWQERGLPLTVAVNISSQDLLNSKLPDVFAELMQQHAASPHWLSLEITESAIMEDPESALDILNQLDRMGLRMSIDDFGTGYSSLAYLKKLPVSELKIDQSFITTMETNEDDSIIVRSTIDLAHNMGLKVIAEGVENEVVWNMLQSMGCDLVQGYYVSRPLTAEALEQWLHTSQWKFAAESIIRGSLNET